MDIERRKYVLTEHRALPEDRQPVWHWILPRAIDVRAARRAAREAAKARGEEGLDGEVLQDQMLARCLRPLTGAPVYRDGSRLQVPDSPELDARIAWCQRLPVRWADELTRAISEGEDLDDSEAE